MTNRRKAGLWIAGALLCGAGVASGIVMYNQNTEKVTPTSVPTEVVTLTPTLTEEVSVSVTPTHEPTEEPTPTATEEVTPTVTEEPTPTDEVTPVVTEEPTPMVTEEPTPVPTDEPTPSVTEEPTPTVTATPTPEPTATPIPTNTPVPTNTPTPTQQPATPTPVPTKAPTSTPNPTQKPTNTPTPTNTPVPTKAPEPTTMWVQRSSLEVYKADTTFTQIDTLEKGTQVIVLNPNVLNRDANYVAEIQYNGGKAYVQYSGLSATKVEPKWTEPRERKDMSQLLMNKVNDYRESKGIRKYEDPYVYDDVSDPGMGPYLYNNALRVAKRCCLEQSANHEGGQIGAGWYSTGQKTPRSAEEVANELFNNWRNSPAHNGNMLEQIDKGYYVDVSVMVVVEYYDGNSYLYCAIMGSSAVAISNLPEGLQ